MTYPIETMHFPLQSPRHPDDYYSARKGHMPLVIFVMIVLPVAIALWLVLRDLTAPASSVARKHDDPSRAASQSITG
jgi:hypothetical protein